MEVGNEKMKKLENWKIENFEKKWEQWKFIKLYLGKLKWEIVILVQIRHWSKLKVIFRY
jgi:hypothetical protein